MGGKMYRAGPAFLYHEGSVDRCVCKIIWIVKKENGLFTAIV